MNISNDIGSIVIESAIASFRVNKGGADKAVAQLPDDKLHVALDANTNSIAVSSSPVASRWVRIQRARWANIGMDLS